VRGAWPALAAYAAAFIGSLVASETLVVAVARARVGGDPARLAEAVRDFALSLDGLTSVAATNAIVLGGVALITARLLGGGVVPALRLGPSTASPAGLAGAVVGTVGLSLACGAAIELLHAGPGTVLHAISSAMHGASPARLGLALLALCVLPGLAEEGLFRGLVQTRLAERWGRAPALVAASMAFGLLHMDPVQGTVAFVVGLYLGWIADRTGSIRPGIAAHAVNNAVFVVLAAVSNPDGTSSAMTSTVVLVVGLAGCVGGARLLRAPRLG
jgi:membrane protease YdiL (CAAX protease family)